MRNTNQRHLCHVQETLANISMFLCALWSWYSVSLTRSMFTVHFIGKQGKLRSNSTDSWAYQDFQGFHMAPGRFKYLMGRQFCQICLSIFWKKRSALKKDFVSKFFPVLVDTFIRRALVCMGIVGWGKGVVCHRVSNWYWLTIRQACYPCSR